jgi:flotillin
MTTILLATTAIIIVLAALGIFIAMMLRRVVPTNMVHIVQSSTKTTPYGRGKAAGNTYYEFPSWVPVLGVTVTQFPESIFKINLDNYEAYDSARLPFVVDVVSFFKVDNAETAAQRVSNFQELNTQLMAVVQGSVRRILATNTLEQIMESRAELGNQFTNEVRDQIKEWGVLPVKMIEFMDLRDAKESNVIANIMAKEKSRIEMESRIKVAENNQGAQLREIDAKRTVEVQRQDAEQQVGLRTAEKDREVGIANEQANQRIMEQSKITAEKQMEVKKVNDVKSAEIARDVAEVKADQDRKVAEVRAEQERTVRVISADAEKESKQKVADADLYVATKDAEGIRLKGFADADAEKALLMAPVDTQIELAKEIGSNQGYQQYLISIKQIDVSKEVGIEMAKAMQQAELKVIANAGDMQGGIAKLGDAFSVAGGMNLTGMLSAVAQTDEGKSLIDRLVKK